MATPLTVSVEWKLLFGYVKEGDNDPWRVLNNDQRRQLGLTQPLHFAGKPRQLRRKKIYDLIAGHIEYLGEIIENLKVKVDVRAGPRSVSSYDSWVVKHDTSISQAGITLEGGTYQFMEVALHSPFLDADNQDEHNNLPYVMATLKEMCRLKLNETCALHVHVGVSYGFTPLHLKKLRTLLWLAEARLWDLCDPDRATDSKSMRRYQYGRLSMFSKLAEGTAGHSPKSVDYETWAMGPFEALSDKRLYRLMRRLWGDENDTVQKVARLLCTTEKPGERRLAFNFWGIHQTQLPGSEGKLSTGALEFRLMEGTFNQGIAGPWVSVCRQLVRMAVDSEPEDFKTLLTNLLRGSSDYTVVSLLNAVGCDTHATITPLHEKKQGNPFKCCDQSSKKTGRFIPALCKNHR